MRLCHPLKGVYIISQYFGENPQYYPASQGHNGVDFAIYRLPVFAMRAGKVLVSHEYSQVGITDGKVGYGRHVRIQHDNGVSIYGHLNRRDVSYGDLIEEGQQIGITGGETSDPNSGMSTGAHLHAEYRLDGVPNPVPGGYAYGAIDILPLFYIPDIDGGEEVLFRGQVIVKSLNIRAGSSKASTIVGHATYADAPYPVYEVVGDWLRIGTNKWFCETEYGDTYVERITNDDPPPTEPTQAEKMDKLWEVVQTAHPEYF